MSVSRAAGIAAGAAYFDVAGVAQGDQLFTEGGGAESGGFTEVAEVGVCGGGEQGMTESRTGKRSSSLWPAGRALIMPGSGKRLRRLVRSWVCWWQPG